MANLPFSSGPTFSQFPSPSGEVKDLSCVAFPWYSSAGVGSGPRELIGVKVETLDTPPSRQTAVEPRHGQPGLFGWHTIPTSAKEVWPLSHTHMPNTTHTHLFTSGMDCVIHYNAVSLNSCLLLTDLVHIASFCLLAYTAPLL